MIRTWLYAGAGVLGLGVEGIGKVQPLDCVRLPLSTRTATTPSQSVRGGGEDRRDTHSGQSAMLLKL